MYRHSENYQDFEGAPFPITMQELADKVSEISGKNVNLMPLREEDASAYFALIEYDRDHLSQHNDKSADKYPSLESVQTSITDPENEFKLRFGIWHEGTMVGTINLTPLENDRAEVGYWIGKQFVGHSHAADALESLANFAFTQLGYTELEAEAHYDNQASRKTLEKCGFQGGEVRGYNYVNEAGQSDVLLYAVFTKYAPRLPS